MEPLRALLTTYAYNITGSLEDARDIVQDILMKFTAVERDNAVVKDKRSYLIRMTINHAMNHKKGQNKIIATYPGEWLPSQ